MSEYLKKNKQMNIDNSKEMKSLATNPYIPNSALADVLSGKKGPTNEMMGHKTNLAPSIQAKMSSAFGMDFSGVKVYTSDFMASTGASGMAQGDKVVLSSDVNLNSLSGQAILGHELSHIHAQAQGIGLGSSGLYSNAALEQQADMEGMMAAKGLSISGESSGMSMGLGMSDFGSLTSFGSGMSSTAGAPMQAFEKPAEKRARLQREAALDYDEQMHNMEIEKSQIGLSQLGTAFHEIKNNENSTTEEYANICNQLKIYSRQILDNEYLSDKDRENIITNITGSGRGQVLNNLFDEYQIFHNLLDTQYSNDYQKYPDKVKALRKQKRLNRKRFNNPDTPDVILEDITNQYDAIRPAGPGMLNYNESANKAKSDKGNNTQPTPEEVMAKRANAFDKMEHSKHYNEQLQLLQDYASNWSKTKNQHHDQFDFDEYRSTKEQLETCINFLKKDEYLSESDQVQLITDLSHNKAISSKDFVNMHDFFNTKYSQAMNPNLNEQERNEILQKPLSHQRKKYERFKEK